MNELRDRPNSEDKGTRIGLIPSKNIWKIIAFNQFAWEILLIYYMEVSVENFDNDVLNWNQNNPKLLL